MEIEISVIMPAYNCERFVKEAVESVLVQTYTNIELIIIDDCSTDRTYKILQDLAEVDGRIKLYKNEQNVGVARTRNFGIEHAKGRTIALLDSDDVWEPDKLELQYQLYQQGNRIVYCSYDFIDDQGQKIKKPFIVPKSTNFEKMLTNNVISCSTILAESNLLKGNRFSEQYYHEDYALWMRLIKIEKTAAGNTAVLAHYRLHDNSRSSKKTNAALQRWIVYREDLKLSIFKSICAFTGYAVKGLIKYYLH